MSDVALHPPPQPVAPASQALRLGRHRRPTPCADLGSVLRPLGRSVDATGQKLDASDHLGNIAEPSAYSLLGGEVAPVLWR